MRSLFTLVVALILCLPALAQKSKADLSPTSFDFGEVQDWKNPPATFTVTNTGKEAFIFLPTFPKKDVLVQLPNEAIQPGESATINVFYYTETPGPFSRKIEAYISTEAKPITFKIQGNILSFAKNALTACPTIGPKNKEDLQFDQEILVIDADTKEPIALAEVKLTATDYKKRFKTPDDGTIVEPLNIDVYAVEASKENYKTVSESVYINRMTGRITIEMERIPGTEPVLASAQPIESNEAEPDNKPIEEEEEEENVEFIELEELEPVEEPVEATSDPEPVEETAELSRARYQANNVVFLIDISSSMKSPYKLPVLKQSMKELLTVLREIDYLTVVTYSIHAQVALPTATADHKAEIGTLIDSLQPGGYTSGVKGLKAAYESAQANFLPNGNNQVIIATDGLFNNPRFDKDAMFDMVRDNARDDIKLSVIGFGTDDEAEQMMKKLARRGNGNYIHMDRENKSYDLLIEEIKQNSLIQ